MAIIPVIIYQIQEMPLYNVNVVNIKKQHNIVLSFLVAVDTETKWFGTLGPVQNA
jgi:hypothetical protein